MEQSSLDIQLNNSKLFFSWNKKTFLGFQKQWVWVKEEFHFSVKYSSNMGNSTNI